jgi:hypothetical protein
MARSCWRTEREAEEGRATSEYSREDNSEEEEGRKAGERTGVGVSSGSDRSRADRRGWQAE